MNRTARICSQISPSPTSSLSLPNLDAFSPHNLRALAQEQHYGSLTPAIVEELKAAVSNPTEQVIVDIALLNDFPKIDLHDESSYDRSISKRHALDRSHFHPIPSLCAIYPASTAEVSTIVKICNTHRIPIQPCGTRTGLEGSSIPILPGVTLDMSRMNKILRLIENEQLVEVEPGVEKLTLQRFLKQKGFFFPVDPGSNACMGGYVNTGASGTFINSTMHLYTRSLEVVTATGEVMITRTRAVKSSAGYNLQGVIVGSEGSLCIVTKILLSVKPIPKVILSARLQFPTTRDATNFTVAMKTNGLPNLTRMELLNEQAINSVNQYANTSYDVKPTIIMECHLTSTDEITATEVFVKEQAKQANYCNYIATTSEEEYEAIWQARKDALFAAYKLYVEPPGCGNTGKKTRVAVFVTDVCVPLPHLPDIISQTEEDFKAVGLPCPIAAHIADANYHCFVPFDTNDERQVELVTKLNAKIISNAIACGGTCTGEHGVGLARMGFLEQERGPTAMQWMRAIKRALDPNCILNPYKVFTPLICEGAGCCQQK